MAGSRLAMATAGRQAARHLGGEAWARQYRDGESGTVSAATSDMVLSDSNSMPWRTAAAAAGGQFRRDVRKHAAQELRRHDNQRRLRRRKARAAMSLVAAIAGSSAIRGRYTGFS
jgi:hypothetical protein